MPANKGLRVLWILLIVVFSSVAVILSDFVITAVIRGFFTHDVKEGIFNEWRMINLIFYWCFAVASMLVTCVPVWLCRNGGKHFQERIGRKNYYFWLSAVLNVIVLIVAVFVCALVGMATISDFIIIPQFSFAFVTVVQIAVSVVFLKARWIVF